MNRIRAHALLDKLTSYYEDCLWGDVGADCLRYLTAPKTTDPATSGRGFTEETIRTWRLGYAPESGDLSEAFTPTEMGFLEELRHFSRQDEADPTPPKDRFAGRAIFPICDDRGQPLGFAGRVLWVAKHVTKYVNSPSHEFFKKGEAIFGIHLARGAIYKANNALTMEGYTDTIAAHQTGRPIAVSIMGTYFTEKQILLLLRYTANFNLMFDGDGGGETATAMSLDTATKMGCQIRQINLPDGIDPDDYFLPPKVV